MDFHYTEEQTQLRDAVARFVQGNYSFAHRKAILASPQGWSRPIWDELAQLGLPAILVPSEHNGLGFGALEVELAMQAAGPAMLVEPIIASAVIATALLRDFADPAHRDALLPQMATGEKICVLAHGESGSSGRTAWVEARAIAQEGGWRLDGHKAVVVHAPAADELLVSARTSGTPADPAGVSLFRVNPNTSGLRMQTLKTIDGLRAADLWFEGLHLPASACVGESGTALPAIEKALDIGVAALCAEAVGVMQATVTATVEYLRTRQQFGQPIGRFQALQHRAVEMQIHLEQARSMSLLAALRCESADVQQREQALRAAKVTINDAARAISQEAVQLHGGMGMTDEMVVSHWFKRLLAIQLTAGDTDTNLQQFAALGSLVPA
jgi:hypothetical protein